MRRHSEQLALEAFSRAVQAHLEAVRRLESIQRELDRAMQVRRACTSRPASDWSHDQAWQAILEGRLRDQSNAVASALHLLNEANRALMLARQGREGVEKLRARRRLHWEQEGRRAEQKVLDEVSRRETLAQGLLGVGSDGSAGLEP